MGGERKDGMGLEGRGRDGMGPEGRDGRGGGKERQKRVPKIAPPPLKILDPPLVSALGLSNNKWRWWM